MGLSNNVIIYLFIFGRGGVGVGGYTNGEDKINW